MFDDGLEDVMNGFFANNIPERGKKFVKDGVHYKVVGPGKMAGYFRCKCVHDLEGRDWDLCPDFWL